MSSQYEIEQIQQSPIRAKILARHILLRSRKWATDWEIEFLEDRLNGSGERELTVPQVEKLLEIRDLLELLTAHRGLSVRDMIVACHEARADLSEGDDGWIRKLYELGSEPIPRRLIRRLTHCARALALIDAHMAA